MELRSFLISRGQVGLSIYAIWVKLTTIVSLCKKKLSDREAINVRWRGIYGYDVNFDNPQTLNEKIQWLKLNFRKDVQTILADKYAARAYLSEHFGEQYLVPLLYETTNWRDITLDNIPDEPCIIKSNHTSGTYQIIRDKSEININELQAKCIDWLSMDYYKMSREWQYKNIKRRIIIEKLLQTKDGKIPNDYKLHYINGNLEFVYCSVSRESDNKRNIYDAEWNPLYFSWVEPFKDASSVRGKEIPAPQSFSLMKEIGQKIADMFAYVRVDFYDVDGKLYIGEITFHHGGGFDVFVPKEYDLMYGEKLVLPKI